jgi:hypothetical protein
MTSISAALATNANRQHAKTPVRQKKARITPFAQQTLDA